ncbi:MAG: CHAT domain-containing protein, partial [Acidobacteriota bacterium]
QAAHDRTLLALGTVEPGTPSAAALRAELEHRREALLASNAELVRAEPRLGVFGGLDEDAVATARAGLPEGTVVLSYLVGSERSLLFVATRDALHAVPIAVGRRALDRAVTTFIEAIARRETLDRPRYRRAAERLTSDWLTPAAASLAAAETVIVLPDGPLHRLPFAALVDPSDRQRYWVETAASVVAPSLVALSELRSRPRPEPGARLAAFAVADPRGRGHEGSAAIATSAIRGAIRAGLDLDPLVHVDREVAALANRFGARTRAYVDADATEEAVKRLDASTRIVHFATHAWVDDRFPLESGLVLTLPTHLQPGDDNGVLQAWEIVEQVRLDAELVTLSGCRTGLGRAFSGEGMLGLTRAFQLAGARAVLASLWPVNDASTSTLMTRFYDHLHQGRTSVEALRAAQLDLVTAGADGGGDLARPYHWAGFQLFGDGFSTWTTAP